MWSGRKGKMLAIGFIEPNDDPEVSREHILQAIQSVNSGQGVVILTDMFGGTLLPTLAISVMKAEGVEVIAGVNLPMMIKLASVRSMRRCHWKTL